MNRLSHALLGTLVFSFTCCQSGYSEEIDAYTEPYREIEIAASEMGTLRSVTVTEGQQVVRGEVLANLDEDVLKASLEMTKTSMESKGRLNSAEAELNLQQQRYKKLVGLRERRHASQVEVDRAAMQLNIAAARVQSVQEDLLVKRMEFERIRAQLELRRVRSPISGVVTHVTKDNGEFVSANDPVVATVVQLDPLRVVFSVPTSTASELSAGQELSVSIGEGRKSAIATIEFVSPTADAQSGTRRVKARIPNPDHRWQSGDICRWNGIPTGDAIARRDRSTKSTVRQLAARPTR